MKQAEVLRILRDEGGGRMRNLSLLARCDSNPAPQLERLAAKGIIARELSDDRLETVWVITSTRAAQ